MSGSDMILPLSVALFLLLSLAVMLLIFAPGGKQMSKRLVKIKARFNEEVAAAERAKARRLRAMDEDVGLANIMKQFVPRPAELRQRLANTGRKLSIGQYAVLCLTVIAVTTVVFFLLIGLKLPLSILLGFLVGVGGPHIVVGSMINRRIKAFTTQFPDAIDLIVRGLRSGLPVAQSMSAVGQEFEDPVGVEFRTVSDKIKIGKSMESALWDTAKKIPTPDFKFFVITLAIQRETGGNLAETLGNLSDILRKRQQLKLKVKAMSSEGRASAYIVGSLPFIMFGLILTLNYEYGIILIDDPRGRIAGIVGLIWMGIGAFIMAKMINFKV
ncbi:MAG: type II secretion system F family protein [Sphingomonadales bacterium]|jgi:tight adherence protein B